jgi:hypothetical protein
MIALKGAATEINVISSAAITKKNPGAQFPSTDKKDAVLYGVFRQQNRCFAK